MPRAIWSGVISFGLVSIPVKLYTATESKSISFNQLHDKCKTRIKQQRWCPHCDRQIEYDEIEKGYEYSKGNYVVITEEDLEQLPLPSKNIINVSAFVQASDIDPIYFDGSYYLEPEKVAQKPYALFMKAMQQKGMVAIGTVAIRNKERLCSLRCLGGNLMVDLLLYPDEVRVDVEKDMPEATVSPQELAMASSLIDIMAQGFKPEEYTDHYREALANLIQSKLEGVEIVSVPETAPTKVIDLMDALRASVENAKSARKAGIGPQAEEEKLLKVARDTADDDMLEAKRQQASAEGGRVARKQAAHTKAASNETSPKKTPSKTKKIGTA